MDKSYIGKNAKLASMVVLYKSKPRDYFELNVDIKNTLGIKFEYKNIAKLSGVLLWLKVKEHPLIIINKEKDRTTQEFVIAQLIGSLILNWKWIPKHNLLPNLLKLAKQQKYILSALPKSSVDLNTYLFAKYFLSDCGF